MATEVTNHAAFRRTPWHLWVVSILGVLWNSIGLFDYFMTTTRRASFMSRFSAEQLAAISGYPIWLVVAWGLAVFGGALGALLLAARKRTAVPVLAVSLVSMAATGVHNAISARGLYATGGTGSGFVLLIFLIALGLWVYARTMRSPGVLR